MLQIIATSLLGRTKESNPVTQAVSVFVTPIHFILFRRALLSGFRSICPDIFEPAPGAFRRLLFKLILFSPNSTCLKAEAGSISAVSSASLFGFICGKIVEAVSLAGYEAAEGVEVVANHEEQLQAALGGLPR